MGHAIVIEPCYPNVRPNEYDASGYGIVAHLLLDPRAAQLGDCHENHSSTQRCPSAQIEEVEEGCEDLFMRQHCGALPGTLPPKGTHFRSAVEAVHAMNNLRPMVARSLYLIALTASMVSWVWVLLAGLGWVLGV